MKKGILTAKDDWIKIMMVMTEGDEFLEWLISDLLQSKGGMRVIYGLDQLGIRGKKLWNLYNFCCGMHIDELCETLNLLTRNEFTEEEIEKNLTSDFPVPFIDYSIIEKYDSLNNPIESYDPKYKEYIKEIKECFSEALKESNSSQLK